ncbi:hypothetical protein BG011_002898 [Mortierella polycephala]|uniref:Uncharacterized protein n=1 Tax=Mortierella polycephala TaxID=41804 RepID=A0A9P6QJJ3_9FUNG|nr:hypothetical protein BG011_002898 [Mortierella polycephala]
MTTTPQNASSQFTRAELAPPRFKVDQQSFMFMDQQPVHVQVTYMDSSCWIWVSAGPSPLMQQTQQLQGRAGAEVGAGGAGGVGGGAFGDLAMAMPPFRAGQPAVSSTLLGSPIDETAAQMARRLATRFKCQFLVNVDIPATLDNAMVMAFSERKVVDILQKSLGPSSVSGSLPPSSTSATPSAAATAGTEINGSVSAP